VTAPRRSRCNDQSRALVEQRASRRTPGQQAAKIARNIAASRAVVRPTEGAAKGAAEDAVEVDFTVKWPSLLVGED